MSLLSLLYHSETCYDLPCTIRPLLQMPEWHGDLHARVLGFSFWYRDSWKKWSRKLTILEVWQWLSILRFSYWAFVILLLPTPISGFFYTAFYAREKHFKWKLVDPPTVSHWRSTVDAVYINWHIWVANVLKKIQQDLVGPGWKLDQVPLKALSTWGLGFRAQMKNLPLTMIPVSRLLLSPPLFLLPPSPFFPP